MQNSTSIAEWQLLLQALNPVQGWLYVGAGRGDMLGEERFKKVPKLLAIEANEHATQLLAHATSAHRNWQAAQALISESNGQATWHHLTREEDNGLLSALALSQLWPNIQTLEQTQHPTITLSQLLEEKGESPESYNWLTIDCLPATRLLQGLNGSLESVDMIEVRVALNEAIAAESGATLEESDAFIQPLGFSRLAVEESTNPLIGRVLYGRNFKALACEQQRKYASLENQKFKLKAELQKARQDISELENQNYILASQCTELKAKKEALLQQENDIQNKLENQSNQESDLREQLEQAQVELKEQMRSAQLSTKLLAKAQADTSDLRKRYAEKVESEQELKDLIKELHGKLQAASHFYRKVEQEHPELLEKW
ncbi:hypothetical protein [Gilvimarinus sp. DA14]|uniref:hypothetical protein n=1 Tax=Gilvimarinus sp. DA14 TaxID=2956798 RepID=UPI0020B8BE82|nr:hypothetical protein [Gilvimarinus sp. DA14]UTF59563.1 hypothetical protein NHM04_13930 [Gilvimarinus sp. DA14]